MGSSKFMMMSNRNLKIKRDQGFSIYHDLVIDASPERVFKAITDPDQLVNWWPYKCSGMARAGAEYNFYFGPEYDWYAKVIRVIPDKAFYIQMIKSDEDWNGTTFGFDLHLKQGKVQLQFWHKGWPQLNEHFRRSSFCWAMLLQGLKNYVENGLIIPFEKRE